MGERLLQIVIGPFQIGFTQSESFVVIKVASQISKISRNVSFDN